IPEILERIQGGEIKRSLGSLNLSRREDASALHVVVTVASGNRLAARRGYRFAHCLRAHRRACYGCRAHRNEPSSSERKDARPHWRDGAAVGPRRNRTALHIRAALHTRWAVKSSSSSSCLRRRFAGPSSCRGCGGSQPTA